MPVLKELQVAAPHATIHHHCDARFAGTLRGGFVDHALLQPEFLDAELDATLNDGGDMLGSTKHIRDVRQLGQAFQVWEGLLAEHLMNLRAHRDDAIAETLQALRNAKTGARLIRRQPDHRDAVYAHSKF